MNPFAVLASLGVLLSLFYGVALLTIDRNNRTANRILAGLILIIGLSIAPVVFSGGWRPPVVAAVLRVIPDVRFLFGPLLHLYTRTLVTRRFRLRWRHLFHALPFHLAAVVSVYFRNTSYPTWYALRTPLVFLCYAHLLLYSVLTLFLIRRHVRSIEVSFSSRLSWLVYLTVAFIAVFCLMTLLEVLHAAGIAGGVVETRDRITAVLVSLFVLSVGFLGLRQPEIFGETTVAAAPKYEGSSLRDDEVAVYHARLETYMREWKPYRDRELTMEKLAGLCGIPGYHLSRVINEKTDKNFHDYVNAHRIREVQELVANPENDRYSILGLAREAGFNSKSAFYASFRKVVGMTPVEYKNAARQDRSRRPDAP